MSEVIIERLDYLKTAKTYVVDCKTVTGAVLPKQVWHLKDNPSIKITFESPVLISMRLDSKKIANGVFYFSILKPNFDLKLFDNPTTWIRK